MPCVHGGGCATATDQPGTTLHFFILFFWGVHTEYAQVTKMLGNGRLEALCFDGVKRLAHIRGKLRKKVRVDIPVPGVYQPRRLRWLLIWFHHVRRDKSLAPTNMVQFGPGVLLLAAIHPQCGV